MILSEKLVENIFTDVKREPNRNGFGAGLVEVGEKNKNVVALTADLAESTRAHKFAEVFPDRFVECGVAEQNMASVASGMAAMGKIPFIASYAMFSPGRSWEQIRTTIAYNNANVKIIGAHAGVSVGPDGATHQAIEDMAIMRVMPNMTVIAPADVSEAKAATIYAAEHKGPLYLRLARSDTPVIFKPAIKFQFGKGEWLMRNKEDKEKSVGIVVTGTLVHEALLAGKELNQKGISASVLHMPTVKPLDTDALDELASKKDLIITLEEHQKAGGLGGAVVEYLCQNQPTRVVRLGVDDEFGQSGKPEELIAHYALDAKSVIATAKNFLD
mgnify:CR=1 FL=1